MTYPTYDTERFSTIYPKELTVADSLKEPIEVEAINMQHEIEVYGPNIYGSQHAQNCQWL